MVGVSLVDQGRAAFQASAWGDAYELLTTADGVEPLAPADLDLLATAAYLTGRDAASVKLWERAHHGFVAAGEVARSARCAFWLGLTRMQRGEHARGGGWLARAGRLLDAAALDCVEWGYLRLPAALRALSGGDANAARATFQEAAGIAQRFGDADLLALSQLGQGQALVAAGDATSGMSLLDDTMVAVTAGEVSPIPAGIIYCGVILACRDVFDLPRAHEWTTALSHWCARQPDLRPFRGQCLVHRSEIMQLRGDWSQAMAEVRRAGAVLADPPGDPVLGVALYQQAELLRLRGELAGAQDAYRRAGDRGHQVQPGMALLRLAQGRTADAAAAIRLAVDQAEGQVARSRMLAAYVEIMLAGGEAEAARAAAGELARIAAAFDSPYLRATAGYAEGAVLLAEGDPRAAAGVLRRSWAAWCELEAPYEAARARLLIGLACSKLGDTDGARAAWDGAGQVFQDLGATPDLVKLARLRQPAPPDGGLTSREVEVLVLVAAGRTNREIAAELVISEHTVRRHLQNIFGKLDLPSRSAATAYAYQHGLV